MQLIQKHSILGKKNPTQDKKEFVFLQTEEIPFKHTQ